jgi:hypothetical protein
MKPITLEKIKVDRVACWLIRRFIDPHALFVFLPPDTDWTNVRDGTVFDVPGCELGHHSGDVSFDSILKKYALDDAALSYMAGIVRAADSHPTRPIQRGRDYAGSPTGSADQALRIRRASTGFTTHSMRSARPRPPLSLAEPSQESRL